MAGSNIQQVYVANPITTNASTDLIYVGQSPYTTGDDAAITFANFAAQFGSPITPAALTKTNDTNVTLTLGGTPATALLQATSITAGWSGTLSLARGGTAANLTASNGGIFYSTASAGAILAGTATANQILLSGSSTTPAWSTATYPATAGTSGNVLTSDGTNWNSTAPATHGTVTSIATNNGITGGTITATGTIGLAAIASHDILSNITSGSAAPTANTLTATIDAALGSTQGDILYRSSSAWTVLAPGTTGNVLTTHGASNNPTWSAAAGGVTSLQVQDWSFNTCSTDTGIADAYLTTLTPSITSYDFLGLIQFTPANPNATTTPTININGVGDVDILIENGEPLQPGDLGMGIPALLQFSGALGGFLLINPIVSFSGGGSGVSPVDIQEVSFTSGIDTGFADLYQVDYTPTILALVDQMILSFHPANTNVTTTPTISIDSFTNIPIFLGQGYTSSATGNVNPGDILVDFPAVIIYNASIPAFHLLNPQVSVMTLQAFANNYYLYAADSNTSANSYDILLPISPDLTTSGQIIYFSTTFPNTTASLINVNSIGSHAIVNLEQTALIGGEILNSNVYELIWNHSITSWVLQNSSLSSGGASPWVAGPNANGAAQGGSDNTAVANAPGSLAYGDTNTAIAGDATDSMAIGTNVTIDTTGPYCFGFGQNVAISGLNSGYVFAFGSTITAMSDYTFYLGNNLSTAGANSAYSFVLGNGCTLGFATNYAIVFGNSCEVDASYGVAMGSSNNIDSTGFYCFTAGSGNTLSGFANGYSCVFGSGNNSSSDWSLIVGEGNTITQNDFGVANYNLVVGNGCSTSGGFNFVMGAGASTVIDASYCIAFGSGITVNNGNSAVWGGSAGGLSDTAAGQWVGNYFNGYYFTNGTNYSVSIDATGNLINFSGTADQSYSLQVPTTGFSITISAGVKTLILNPAGTLLAGTVTLPAAPIDGQEIRICSDQIITTLTVSPNSGQSLANAFAATLGAGAGISYIYNLSGTTWYRLY